MVQQCETCGQPLPHDPADRGVWLAEPDASGTQPHAPVAGAASPVGAPRRLTRRWLAIVAAVVVGWLVVVGAGRLAAPGDVAEVADVGEHDEPGAADAAADSDDGEATPTPTPSPPTPDPSTQTEASTESSAVNDTSGDDGQGGEGAGAEPFDINQLGAPRPGTKVQVDRLVRQLGRRGSQAVLAFRARGGVVVVDLAEGTALVVPATGEIEDPDLVAPPSVDWPLDYLRQTQGLAFLSAGAEVFAIDRTSLDVSLLATDASLVVTEASTGIHHWVPGPGLQGQATQAVRIEPARVEWNRVPVGFQLVVADDLGLLAVGRGRSAPTSIAAPGGFEPFSDHRVFAANANASLEHVCDDDVCHFEVRDLASGETATVASEFVDIGDRFSLSPDGRKVLRSTPHGFAEVFDLDDRSTTWVTGTQLHQAAWGPESNLVAWLDTVANELSIMFLAERDWLTIPLDNAEEFRPITHDLIVFAPLG